MNIGPGRLPLSNGVEDSYGGSKFVRFLFACLPVCPLSRLIYRDADWFGEKLDANGRTHRILLIDRMQDHRRLHVWKKAHALAIEVRRATREFPRTGYGSLQSQMIRAAESIVFNIVEGCGGRSPREFARFLDIGIKSTSELESQLELAKDYGVLSDRHWQTLAKETVDVRRMLCGLRAKVLAPARNSAISTQRANGQTGKQETHKLGSPQMIDVDPD